MSTGVIDSLHKIVTNPWVFTPDDLDGLEAFYREYGFGVLTGLLDEETIARLEEECVEAQSRLVAGELDAKYGTARLIENNAGEKAAKFANYVVHITELSPTANGILHSETTMDLMHRWLGPSLWSAADRQFGFVYQDARPGRESSYTRIGWHSDWQSSPHLDIWPSTAVTIHVDGTSPANGFLRVVPGSHKWATPPPYENVNAAVVPDGAAAVGGYTDEPPPYLMPLRFEKVPGEIAVYADRGDILFHDCYLWHSAALATDSEPSTARRHVRGGWFGGPPPERLTEADFVKNAAR
jgi:hypothetical protein